MVILENIDIDMDFLENIDIDMDFLENIDIDKGILQNIDIDKISYRLEFGISNRATRRPVCRKRLSMTLTDAFRAVELCVQQQETYQKCLSPLPDQPFDYNLPLLPNLLLGSQK